MANPNPVQSEGYRQQQAQPLPDVRGRTMGKRPIAVRYPKDIEDFLLSLPTSERTQFIRGAVLAHFDQMTASPGAPSPEREPLVMPQRPASPATIIVGGVPRLTVEGLRQRYGLKSRPSVHARLNRLGIELPQVGRRGYVTPEQLDRLDQYHAKQQSKGE